MGAVTEGPIVLLHLGKPTHRLDFAFGRFDIDFETGARVSCSPGRAFSRDIAPGPGLWFVHETRISTCRREFRQMYEAAVDDFGSLVEVPR